jgi:hypothetical protein
MPASASTRTSKAKYYECMKTAKEEESVVAKPVSLAPAQFRSGLIQSLESEVTTEGSE